MNRVIASRLASPYGRTRAARAGRQRRLRVNECIHGLASLPRLDRDERFVPGSVASRRNWTACAVTGQVHCQAEGGFFSRKGTTREELS